MTGNSRRTLGFALLNVQLGRGLLVLAYALVAGGCALALATTPRLGAALAALALLATLAGAPIAPSTLGTLLVAGGFAWLAWRPDARPAPVVGAAGVALLLALAASRGANGLVLARYAVAVAGWALLALQTIKTPLPAAAA